ncbi:TIGR03067 domain-containing protein [Gemmata sp. JC673]|uniref:TIGR03067 domain-containing protein n=1 Tax=Gemmata algarum TaxID=2975278 RepID=A0ABU5EWX1_9BACT|nr:TIGR03067 domain-containing protein [Gemmata algarum]MDY3559749.1 TIGR03067 domain-containing protein [Gemmata algarum]
MKTFALVAGLVACSALIARAADEKLDLAGTYTLVAGKKNGADVDATAKKAQYIVTADKFTIKGGEITFVMGYKLDAKATPAQVDMEILEGPEGTKGTKAIGILELKGDTLKIAYSLDKEKRPKEFDGKTGYYFELKKEKAK